MTKVNWKCTVLQITKTKTNLKKLKRKISLSSIKKGSFRSVRVELIPSYFWSLSKRVLSKQIIVTKFPQFDWLSTICMRLAFVTYIWLHHPEWRSGTVPLIHFFIPLRSTFTFGLSFCTCTIHIFANQSDSFLI